MNTRILGIFSVLSSLAFVTGCGAARDVEVEGKVAVEPGVDTHQGIRLEFYERSTESGGDASDGAESKLEFVSAFALDEAGDFTKTISVAGDTIHVLALADANDDEQCNAGEAWGEAEVTVANDDTAAVTLRVIPQERCPVLPAE